MSKNRNFAITADGHRSVLNRLQPRIHGRHDFLCWICVISPLRRWHNVRS
jgi:hypothetical protein